jgi:phosphoadenosine phosphosulfate reductase
MDREIISKLAADFREADAEELLRHFLSAYKDRIALASSLGAEDQVLTHIVLSIRPDARIFILDTGRLHGETYDLMDRTMKQYGMRYEFLFPEAADVEEMESVHGPNHFYDSVENRKQCCIIRKVKPLRRVLSTLDVWITGLRKGQAVTRNTLEKIEWDKANGLVKLNPLADWSEERVWQTIREHDIPYNKLHDKGYPSIGCAPCTRAIKPGEDIRAGRWWWETPEQKECGLHMVEGKLVRIKS